uniref:Uncharacterized protein n=1 Tax=Anopheles darlingi TaxID=43151 RepID=A0A2M4D9N5_ANODA
MQNASISMYSCFTSIILFLIRLCRNTHTNLTRRFSRLTARRFWIYLSLIVEQLAMLLTMYKWTKWAGRSTEVVKRFTTSIECSDSSMPTISSR